jgi:hypothetical protein
MGRLRPAELVAGGGALLLLAATLLLDWYSGASAWEAFSVLDVVLALLALPALMLVVAQATRVSPACPVFLSVVSIVTGLLAVLLIGYRILNQPGPNDAVEVDAGAWIGLAAAALMLAGACSSARDESMPRAKYPPVEKVPAPSP